MTPFRQIGKPWLTALGMVLIVVGFPGMAPAQSLPALEITYLANEGVLLSAGDGKILIDALFREGVFGYEVVPDSLRESLETARPPFDGIDAVLVTHRHRDHFHPGAVLRHLRHNRATHFVAGPEVVERSIRHAGEDSALQRRLHPLLPDWPGQRVFSRGRVEITALRLRHSSARNYDLHHLGFLLRLGGQTILHIGDAEMIAENFAPFRLYEHPIDVALIPLWFLLTEQGRAIIDRWIRPKKVVVMHIPRGQAATSRQKIRRFFPEAIMLETPLQVVQLP